ncbi:hypothetical protein FPOA_13552 [Fusarium poae]|uniref:Uncharacterized protein n=1 Tax=Fusarium poae TaxID=36050 RepID=A0A1B8A573_FUSPO|nr:hypothetical protein FPOA_13552 [Fusarium poae]
MQLPTANDDLIGSGDGTTLDDIYDMPSDDRRSLFHKYLVNKDKPILVQEPIAWSDDESIGRFFLLKKFLDEDESKKHLLLEARRVFYEENSFVLLLSGLSRFLDDMLGDWEDAVPVEMLVRDLTVKVERNECHCGQLLDYIQRLTYFAKMPQLQKITVEWHSPTENVDQDLPNDWSTLSSLESSRGDSLNSPTDDDDTYDSGDFNEASAWGYLEDDAWSLDEGVEG